MDHPRPIRLLIFLGLFFSILFLSNAASANRGIRVAPIYDEAENPAQFVVEPRPMKTGSIEQSKSSKKVETPIPENMTLITAGKFLAGMDPKRGLEECRKLLGNTCQIGWYIHEGPEHHVWLDAFYIDLFEVTQKDFERVMGKNPSKFKEANRPVERVTWEEANNYCRRL